ncbi:MAG: sulfotransferase family protein [Phycisphaerales bacterium]
MGVERPIILIGTHRSGTTWLGDLFSRHPRVAYWVEPRHIWTWGSGYRPDDVLTEADATPRVVAHIRDAFERFMRERDRDRFAEKTPSNTLRLRFVNAVFPDARILLLIRDGRSVIRSTDEIMRQPMPMGGLVRRAMQTPLWEWPAYAPRAMHTITRRFSQKPLDFWGPRPPGWREWVDADPRPVVLARQWSGAISRALDDAAALSDANILEVRYERLMARPSEEMRRIAEFIELPDPDPVIDAAASTADASRVDKWRDELDAETLDLIRPHMEPTLRRLGYEW